MSLATTLQHYNNLVIGIVSFLLFIFMNHNEGNIIYVKFFLPDCLGADCTNYFLSSTFLYGTFIGLNLQSLTICSFHPQFQILKKIEKSGQKSKSGTL